MTEPKIDVMPEEMDLLFPGSCVCLFRIKHKTEFFFEIHEAADELNRVLQVDIVVQVTVAEMEDTLEFMSMC